MKMRCHFFGNLLNSQLRRLTIQANGWHVKKFHRLIFSFSILIFIFQPIHSIYANQGTGLILPTEDELRSVPLAHTPFSGTELPANADLSPDLPPPGFQGKQNSCVGWALAYAMKSYQEKQEQGYADFYQGNTLHPDKIFSPAFIYNQTNNGRDGGVHIHIALNLLQEKGVCTWNDMPYSSTDYRIKPNARALQNAKKYRINTWRRVNTQSTREIKTHIQAGFPVIIGAMVDQSFESFNNPPGWIWRQTGGAVTGAHAMLVIGYDDSKQAFKVMNSWGHQWGDQGYGWIDYQHFRSVVRVGYVTMDATNTAASSVQKDPVNTVTSNTTHVTPAPLTQNVRFWITDIRHNVGYPNRPDLGQFLRIDGRLQIPGNTGKNDQVVIHFFHQLANGQAGSPVPGIHPQYSDSYGNAACGTAVYPIPATGLDTTFAAWISYSAFNIPSGQWIQSRQGPQYQPRRSHLVGIPTLFIDNFGVTTGKPIYFSLDR